MKNINFGCGQNLQDGYLNIDKKDLDLDVFPYDIKTESVDNIGCYEVLEHLENPYKTIKEFHRLLKKGGILRISVPHVESDLGKNPLHKHVFHEDWFYSFDINKKKNNVFSNENNKIPIDDFPKFSVQCLVLRGSDIFHLNFPKKKIMVEMIK